MSLSVSGLKLHKSFKSAYDSVNRPYFITFEHATVEEAHVNDKKLGWMYSSELPQFQGPESLQQCHILLSLNTLQPSLMLSLTPLLDK